MKRLLAYLFIVLGLGLVFLSNSFAKPSICVEIELKPKSKLLSQVMVYKKVPWASGCNKKKRATGFKIKPDKSYRSVYYKLDLDIKRISRINKNKKNFYYFYSLKELAMIIGSENFSYFSPFRNELIKIEEEEKIAHQKWLDEQKKIADIIKKEEEEKKKIQKKIAEIIKKEEEEKKKIAKVEPSQTQEVVGKVKKLLFKDGNFQQVEIFGKEPNPEMRCKDSPTDYKFYIYKWKNCQGTFKDKDGKWYTAWFKFDYGNSKSYKKNKTLVHYDGNNFYYGGTEQTQIAKVEPSQTQEVAKFKNKGLGLLKEIVEWYAVVKHASKDYYKQKKYIGGSNTVIYDLDKGFYILNPKNAKDEAILIAKKKCWKDYPNSKSGCLIDRIRSEERNKPHGIQMSTTLITDYWEKELAKYNSKNKTQLAKKEPSQTQEIAKKIVKEEIFSVCTKGREAMGSYTIYYYWSLKQYQRKNPAGCNIIVEKTKAPKLFKEIKVFFDKKSSGNTHILMMQNKFNSLINRYVDKYAERNIMIRGYSVKINYVDSDKTQIAKVVGQEQEEFKPEDKDIDNDAPVIQIAEAITVDSQAYTLKGKVKDKSKIYLTIDGRQVQVKKGKFKVDRFNIDPDEVEEIKIVAIDKWNNKTEKTIKITIDLQSTELVRSFEDLKPNSVRVKTDKNKIAIIIGIEKYANLINLDAKYANRDAKAFRTYATQALGVKASNIKILVDNKATRSQTIKAFKLWLPRIAGDGGKDILIFFAGHGLASDNGEDLYILPQDGESSLLEDTAISRVELISLVQKVNPKSVTMFFDTCYSGQTRDERMLVASLRPIRIVADEQDTPNNFTIFTASNYDQTSGSIEEAKHGMFSYYLMKGLEGKADNNKDKKITNGELIAYLKTNVSKEAFTQNREQDPMLSGDPDKILMSYR